MLQDQEYNAKITSTSLGYEDHGIMTAYIFLEGNGFGVGFGGYSLDQYDKSKDTRIDKVGIGVEFVRQILDTVGVEKWEDLPGKYVVVKSEGWGGSAIGIRNLIDTEKWFMIKDWFKIQNKELFGIDK